MSQLQNSSQMQHNFLLLQYVKYTMNIFATLQ